MPLNGLFMPDGTYFLKLFCLENKMPLLAFPICLHLSKKSIISQCLTDF